MGRVERRVCEGLVVAGFMVLAAGCGTDSAGTTATGGTGGSGEGSDATVGGSGGGSGGEVVTGGSGGTGGTPLPGGEGGAGGTPTPGGSGGAGGAPTPGGSGGAGGSGGTGGTPIPGGSGGAGGTPIPGGAGGAGGSGGAGGAGGAIVPDLPAALPFFIDDYYVMSGFMGGGTVDVAACDAEQGDPAGDCRRITWTPGGEAWVGFFFQYPADNWGDLPGLPINPGATHVRFRAWGATGGEHANFMVGIRDADGFSVESGYVNLGAEPADWSLTLGEGVPAEVVGGFAWFLDNPTGAESVTFYLDDIQWRDDAPPVIVGPGCTDPAAVNFDEAAVEDDGSCRYPVQFAVDMGCSNAFTTPYITGPFCNWCAEGFPLMDDDGDGVYTASYDFPNGPLEYKYMVDGFAAQEDLVDDVIAGNGACAPVTDGANYANRQIAVAGPTATDDVYGSCSACVPPEGVAGCIDPAATNFDPAADRDDGSCLYAITFRVDMRCSGVQGVNTVHATGPFCGWCDRGFDLQDADADGIWEGTFSFAAGVLEYKYMVNNWAFQEDLVDDMVAGGMCAPVTDLMGYANRQIQVAAPVTLDETYGSCNACPM